MPTDAPQRDTLERVKTLLRRDLKLGDDAVVEDGTPLLGGDHDLDSLDVLLLVTSVEKHFGIKIPNDAVSPEAFADVRSLARFVEARAGERPPSGPGPEAGPPELEALPGRLPHRPPFHFISRVLEMEAGRRGAACWEVTGAEPFLAGHFPARPLVPGVLIVEALGQLAGLVAYGGANDNGHVAAVLAHVDVRFDRAVTPPARIALRAAQTRALGSVRTFEVEASDDRGIVARGSVSLGAPDPGAA